MTTQIKFRFVGLLATLFMMSNSFSQKSNVENLESFPGNIYYDNVNRNVLTEFEKHFGNAENVSWYNINKNFGVKFTFNDLRYQALLNRQGKILYKITYGKEKHLPVDIRKAVKREYVEFLITAASLVEENDRKIWVIQLEDDSNHVIVRFENNEMAENMSYKKEK